MAVSHLNFLNQTKNRSFLPFGTEWSYLFRGSLEEYYEKHPLDNSYEGILARRSGLTKEQVVAYLDKLDYLAKVVDYDPTNKAPILKQEAQKLYRFHVNSEDNAEYTLGVNDCYIEDRKIRNFAV